MLGAGSYGRVTNHQVAMKSYNLTTALLNRDLIVELSTIKYLNSMGVKGIPVIHNVDNALVRTVSSHTNKSRTYSRSRVTMSLGGNSLSSIIEKLSLEQSCRIIAYYLPSIIDIITSFHSYGVVHNDLKLDNILIDGHNIMIVDFGLSDFDGHSNYHSAYHQYYVPERFNSDDDYKIPVGVSNDIWILAAFIANTLLWKLSKPIIPLMKSDAYDKDFFGMLSKKVDRRDYHSLLSGNIDSDINVMLPDDIPEQLRDTLSGMLMLNPDYRSYHVDIRYPYDLPSNMYSRSRILVFSQYLAHYLDNVERWRDDHNYKHIDAVSILVGIDVLRRCINMNLTCYPGEVIGLSIYLIVCEYMRYNEVKTLIDAITNDNILYKEVFRVQLIILEHINWMVFTPHNTTQLGQRLSSQRDLSDNNQNIIDDNLDKILNLNNHDTIKLLI